MDDKIVRDFFNGVFTELIPWVNEFHPAALSMFPIQEHFPGIIDIYGLGMEVKENFISFGMDPELLVY